MLVWRWSVHVLPWGCAAALPCRCNCFFPLHGLTVPPQIFNWTLVLQNPATHAEAERVILEFHNAADPIPACVHVLQTSHDVGAIFQAAVALRKACMNTGWAKLSQHSRLELRVWVLQFIVHHGKGGGHGPMAPVLQTMLEAHAIILKLLWLDLPQEQSCAFTQVRFHLW